MLPIKNRLSKRTDFQQIYQNGKFFSVKGIAIKFAATSLSETRIGFSIGKSFSKKATERNHVRRLLREAFRLHIDNMRPNYDMIVMYQRQEKHPRFDELSNSVNLLLKKCGLLK